MCKITAPDDEPQRGTVIQTDDDGRIATMPVGTPDRPVSRILSRDEYDRLNTPQGRSSGEARAEMGFGREQDLARQASRGIAEFGPPSARANAPDVMGGFRQGDVTVNQATGLDLFRDMDAQRAKDFEKRNVLTPATPPSERELLDMTSDYNRAFFLPETNQAINKVNNPRQDKIYGLINKYLKDDPELAENYPDNVLELLDFATDKVNKEEYLANLQAYSPRGENKLSSTSGFEQPYASDYDQDPQFPQSGTFGARPNVPNDMFLERGGVKSLPNLNEMTRNYQAAFAPKNVPNKSDYEAAFAPKYNYEVGRDSDDLGNAPTNPAVKQFGINPIVERIARMQGFDMDSNAGVKEYLETTRRTAQQSDRMSDERRRDQDRAMQSQSTQQPFDPCPAGFKYDESKKQCVPIAEETTGELGQKYVRNPVAFAGDPNMYGRTGGEYNFFSEVPGLIKAANGIPRGPTGEIRGQGGPKDDLVGPFMLSDQEYVLPKEMVMAAGGGNYDTGIKQLETMRKNSLNNYGDYV